jgi:hypothetical protein
MSLRGKFKGLINPLNFSQLVTQVLTTSEVICILNYMVNVDLGCRCGLRMVMVRP